MPENNCAMDMAFALYVRRCTNFPNQGDKENLGKENNTSAEYALTHAFPNPWMILILIPIEKEKKIDSSSL
jgi:hypothetical protein